MNKDWWRRFAALLGAMFGLNLVACEMVGAAAGAAGNRVEDRPVPVIQSGITNVGVSGMAYSSTGRWLATDNIVWDVSTGRVWRVFEGATNVVDAAFSPDESRFAVAGSPEILVWNTRTGVRLHTLRVPGQVLTSLAFDPSGRKLCGGSEGGGVFEFDAATGRQTRRFSAHRGEVSEISFSPNGKWLATVGFAAPKKREVKIFDTASGQLKRTIALPNGEIFPGLDFHPDSARLAVGLGGKNVVFDVATGRQRLSLPSGRRARMIGFSPDGKLLAGSAFVRSEDSLNDYTGLWDATTGKTLREIPGAVDTCLAFNPDGGTLAVAGIGRGVGLYEVVTGEQERWLRGYGAAIRAMDTNAAGTLIASASEDEKSIRLWDLRTGDQTRRFAGVPLSVNDEVDALAFSPDGWQLAALVAKEVWLWNVGTGEVAATFKTGFTSASAFDFSPDGRRIAVGGSTYDVETGKSQNLVTQFDLESGRATSSLRGHKEIISGLAYSADGNRLVSIGFDKTLRVWNTASGALARQMALDSEGLALSLSADGATAASGDASGKVQLWDVASGRLLRGWVAHRGGTTALTYLSDGTLLSGGADHGLRLWDTAAGTQRGELKGHGDQLSKTARLANGVVVSGGADGQIKLWDIAARREKATWVPISPEGNILVTPEGFYRATPDAREAIAFRVGDHAYGFQQFDLRFNRPDRVLVALDCPDKPLIDLYRRAYEKRLRLLGVVGDAQARPVTAQPTLELQTDRNTPSAVPPVGVPRRTQQHRVTIPVSARIEAGAALGRLRVAVNGVPTRFWLNGEAASARGALLPEAQSFDGGVEVELSSVAEGRNDIGITVESRAGIAGLTRSLGITREGEKTFASLFVVSVGVSKYRNDEYNLRFADKDARDFVALWQSQAESFADVHTLLLTNEDVTREATDQIQKFLARAGVDDLVVFFVAGHGTLDERDDYFFGTHDIDFTQPAQRGLAYEAIVGVLDEVAARRKLLLMDTCHAGEVDKDDDAVVAPPVDAPPVDAPPVAAARTAALEAEAGVARGVSKRGFRAFKPAKAKQTGTGDGQNRSTFMIAQQLFEDLRPSNGTSVIAAAAGAEYAFEERGNGVFTASLLEGLRERKADADSDGAVSVQELRDYLSHRVRELTRGRQTPLARRENRAFDFRLF